MAIEEPSVVAAVSGAAKTICGGVNDGQGFRAVAKERNLATAQVLLLDLDGSAIARALDKVGTPMRSLDRTRWRSTILQAPS
ncbi:MAG: hypothetical protein BJ554DRAFT_953 [Olpidium bornovanus]|uniref:Uncharacterized protein n=1 Tax=Olpidium bornovanus TaxID=278681 RepID=A0A8H8DI68_9FUNG|nr:MAG: hypothetical protein BJ554DRAFT_953 [Olpidium bornovanus]